ncbi:dehydrogenase/reductase-like protein [Dinothrombium tinctorium]|uniref:Dehydrogenase/reductase-like protein n=1 Tax=Dinothrombium tinctorium TaxID=1965070 RepID=A0A3S3PN28_9ACAR|nr:dehydrogenase/reductase-like protein [Dinothrombium tinctorium]RWS15927.1 dehydrogenase/reductase-like protein [Dinothrombium tinctorium]
MEFENKVVLVTGSSSGIGEQIALDFAKNGAKVVVTGRNQERVEAVRNKCSQISPNQQRAIGVIADLTDDSEMRKLIESTIIEFGQLDVLVNNAGTVKFVAVDDPSLITACDAQYRNNLRPYIYLSNLAIPHLIKTKGCIVNISSTSALKPEPEMLPINVIDAGKDMVTRSMALELGPKGVRVNSVQPGWIKTPMYEKEGLVFEELEGFAKQPLKKVGLPEDVSHCVLFLASSKAAFITGTCLQTDAGLLDA